jgi:endonuclease/exonuclease/phosphatase family metal-dependent hydrolase
MQPFKKPTVKFDFNLEDELGLIRKHHAHRNVPAATDKNLLVATWNLTNFGMQKREDKHLKIMAEIIRPFDVIAVQEVADDLKHFEKLMTYLGKDFDEIYTDTAGNDERAGFLFNTKRVVPTGLAAELAMRSTENRVITVDIGDVTETTEFKGFNRNPYMVNFLAGTFECTLVNVHLYWTLVSIRILEAKALTKWAKSRVDKKYPPNNDIILLGDFNMPRVEKGDEICDTLTKGGLQVPKFNTELVGSNLAGDKDYDELAFFPSRTAEDFTKRMGVFDFDKALFPSLWSDSDKAKQQDFFQYMRYYISDHRPLWAEFCRTPQ